MALYLWMGLFSLVAPTVNAVDSFTRLGAKPEAIVRLYRTLAALVLFERRS